MPGQRFASLKIRCTNASPGANVSIWLNGAYQRFTPPPAPLQPGSYVASLLVNDIPARLQSLGQGSTYTTAFVAGADAGEGYVLITATSYETSQDFQPLQGSGSYAEVERLAGIKPVFIDVATTQATCFGSSTGAIALTPGNGTSTPSGPYTYLWDDGVTTQSRTNQPAGTYTVTVTDNGGAYAAATIRLGQNTAITVGITRAGTALATVVAGGVAPYTYQWADGPTTPDRLDVVGGVTYTVTVTDALGCSKEASLRFELLRYWFSGNPIPLALDAGPAYRLDPATKPGLRFACQVFVEAEYGSGTFVQVGPTLEQPADAAGRTTFEVQELLEPYVQPHLPALNQPYAGLASGLFRRFYLRHYELTDDGPGPAVSLDDNFLVRGGLGFVEAAAGTWFSRYQPTRLPFLTWEPATKTVLPDQPEYLYYLVPQADTTALQLQVRLVFSDATTFAYVHTTLPAVQRFEVYCLPAGFALLGLVEFETPTRRVVSWDVALLDQADAGVSETRTYVLDRKPVPTRRYFLYANSLGGVNTLAARGRALQQLATTTRSGEAALPAGYDPAAGDVRVDRKTGQATLKNYAGTRDPDQLRADQNFVLSERVVLQQDGRYLAGTVKDRTFTPLDEDETRRVLEFEFELPRERFYTPALR